ncbi:hypothetical protein [Phyllobacterium endophyticum]|uniref:hypothetical protein n=1 Tax=Phyllobacterium endophyticum TaxID=1149773 RepID=UPI0011C72C5D|nr:hypothetical protein [Phyllobacterium endophyticum]TXR47810.1 hypothetical protein FVA77_17325 [Phyllobacterium endophyticum]
MPHTELPTLLSESKNLSPDFRHLFKIVLTGGLLNLNATVNGLSGNDYIDSTVGIVNALSGGVAAIRFLAVPGSTQSLVAMAMITSKVPAERISSMAASASIH